ncbi:MAG: hypothetical protein ACR2I8_08790 [Steroidobacteraceae bacterium]
MTEPDKKQTSDQPTDDWETATLRRIAQSVETLPEPPAEAEDFGWEEGVLENLRRRLAANDK